jgi:hypothetical protein
MLFDRHYENSIIIEVWDADKYKKDDLIGVLSIPLENILKNNNNIGTYQLTYENKVAGSIRLEIIWRPDPILTNINKNVESRDIIYNVPPQSVKPHNQWSSPLVNINQSDPYLNPSIYPTSINSQIVLNQYSGYSNIYPINQTEYPPHNLSEHENCIQTHQNTKSFSSPIGSPSSNPIQNSFLIYSNYQYKP